MKIIHTLIYSRKNFEEKSNYSTNMNFKQKENWKRFQMFLFSFWFRHMVLWQFEVWHKANIDCVVCMCVCMWCLLFSRTHTCASANQMFEKCAHKYTTFVHVYSWLMRIVHTNDTKKSTTHMKYIKTLSYHKKKTFIF